MRKTIAISRIFKSKHGTIKASDNATLDIKKGEFVNIISPSGSVKSTLLLALGGMSYPGGSRRISVQYGFKLNINIPAGKPSGKNMQK